MIDQLGLARLLGVPVRRQCSMIYPINIVLDSILCLSRGAICNVAPLVIRTPITYYYCRPQLWRIISCLNELFWILSIKYYGEYVINLSYG